MDPTRWRAENQEGIEGEMDPSRWRAEKQGGIEGGFPTRGGRPLAGSHYSCPSSPKLQSFIEQLTSVPLGFDSDATNNYDGQACEDMEDDTGNGDEDDVDDDNGDGGGVPETDKGGDSNGRNDARRGQKKGRNAKLILDKCENVSGLPSYWDTDLEKRKELQVPLAFEKPLRDTMQWKLNRPSMTCDQTLGSEDLPGAGEGTPPPGRSGSGKSGSEARGTDGSEGAAKMRRTSSGRTRMDEAGTDGSTLARAMEDSTRSYCDGLDKAASTLAKATSDVGTAMAVKIGNVAEKIRGGNIILEMLVGVLARRYVGSAGADDNGGDTNPTFT
ncbi:hypothetical protein CBR_g28551 [Chara braunii]|uniref:Uncharacterized protein n=1 Tax=Chara braunii TaxID=69332 RepID=A0A388JWB2_CHABU|nr:hypothetical protein CBR_g28551 [Chara braunii]|eukprot:GBG62075.1 hypothetical protein CBR_g28551 [Chara braunii]